MEGQLALDQPVCQQLDMTHTLVSVSSLATTGVMTTTFITSPDTTGTSMREVGDVEKHSTAGQIKRAQ